MDRVLVPAHVYASAAERVGRRHQEPVMEVDSRKKNKGIIEARGTQRHLECRLSDARRLDARVQDVLLRGEVVA
jgi:hypothetical protein